MHHTLKSDMTKESLCCVLDSPCSLWQTCAPLLISPSVASWTWRWAALWKAWGRKLCWALYLSTSPATSKCTKHGHKRCGEILLTLPCFNWLTDFYFERDDLEFPRSWMVPVIRDHVKNTHLGFFTSYFLPLASTFKQRGKSLMLHLKVSCIFLCVY